MRWGANIDPSGACQTYLLIKLKKTTSISDTQSEGGLED